MTRTRAWAAGLGDFQYGTSTGESVPLRFQPALAGSGLVDAPSTAKLKIALDRTKALATPIAMLELVISESLRIPICPAQHRKLAASLHRKA